MTSWAVLDSSILLATVLPERFSQEAIALLTSLTGRQTQIAVPTLFTMR
jgi:predicted nucleic acid-binding protein